MKNITIINAYGEKNLGDAAILQVALQLIREAYGNNSKISILCQDTKSIQALKGISGNIVSLSTPYGYAVHGNKEKAKPLTKIVRFLIIYTKTYLYIWLQKLAGLTLPDKGFYSYISAIKKADLIIGMGGGYLTANSRKDYFGLFLSLLPIYVSKIYKKRVIFLPISFGPFATAKQERISYQALKDSTVMARDNITLKQLQVNDTSGRIKKFYAPDLALFLKEKNISVNKKLESNYIVMTAREWFADYKKQHFYEESLVSFIEYVYERYKLKTVFVPMAKNIIEDDDNRVAKRLIPRLKNKTSFQIYNPGNLEDLQNLLSLARLAICTRMHSAILAVTTKTPFIAIGYGHKTLGFVRSFNLEKWHVDIKDTDYKILKKMFDNLLLKKNYYNFVEDITTKQKDIKKYSKIIVNEMLLTTST